MIYYLVQTIVFQVLFLGVYELFLKKETFFSWNRAYLLITPFLAAVIPLLEFEVFQNMVPVEGIVQLPALIISENAASDQVSTAINLTRELGIFDVIPSLLIGYLLGAVVSFVLFLRKYLHLQNLKNSGSIEKRGKIKIVRIPKSRMACTFFNTIFLGEDLSKGEMSQILAHEMVHVAQKHSWDLLLFEVLRILLWFDPFIYRYQLQLSLLHEYIADEKVTQNSEKTTYFQDLLNATFGTRQISFTNQFFNHSLIKKRIVMLQKPKSNPNAKWKYLLLLPMVLLMLTYVACSTSQIDKNTETQGTIVKITPETPPPPPPMPPTSTVAPPPPPPPPSRQVVPFSVVEQVPVFPGCKNLSSNEAQKACMSKKIREFVNANFNTDLAKQFGLKGSQRIQVMFKINQNGEVGNVKARASHPALKKEAIRVVSSLPDMIPGKQDGKAISVLYSLPILFQAE